MKKCTPLPSFVILTFLINFITINFAFADNWVLQAPLPGDVSANKVSCPTANHCVAVGEGGAIVSSSDGGKSWELQTSGVTENLFSVDCPTESRCFAGGLNGTMIRSSDGG